MDQTEFDLNGPITRADQIEKRFIAFHKANPQVWLLFQRFAFEAINAGYEHYGAPAIFERIRWHVSIETRSQDGLKINDHYRAYYARLFEVVHPEHTGFFRNRKRTSTERSAYEHDVAVFNSGVAEGEEALRDRLRLLIST